MSITSIVGLDSENYSLLKEGIKASTLRAEAISNNIANINTRDYKRFNVVFEENLTGNNKNGSLDLKVTKDKHISIGDKKDGNISVERDESTSMRTDGNNVDLEVEKVNQAANTLKYNTLIQQANSKLTNIKYVISGGN